MKEYHECKGCRQIYYDSFEIMKHTVKCLPKNYEGVLYTTFQ